jgi:ligand-binding sensor domain-containing protein/signal transduction histidine kinase
MSHRLFAAKFRRCLWLLAAGGGMPLLFNSLALASADTQSYRIDTWQVEDGLPQSSITAIVQTRDGYLWLGTFHGLVRFDGVQFKVFSPNTAPGLPSSRILRLFEDREGALWIGTEEGSVARYVNGTFETLTAPKALAGYIRAFAQTSDGALWVMTSERQLVRLLSGQWTVGLSKWNLAGTGADALATDKQGRLWVATDRVIAMQTGGGFETVFEQSAELNPRFLARSIHGGCWAAVNGGLKRFEEGKCVEDAGAFPWSKGDLYYMFEDRDGQLWLGTYGSGLFRYSTNHEVLHLSTPEGLPGVLVRSLCQDREGDLWVGTEGDGLARLKPALFKTYGRKQGLSGDCILSVCEGADGELWIGTNGDGVNRLHRGALRHYGPAEGLTNECVWSVFQDHRGTPWVGTWGGGLLQLQGEKFVPVDGLGEGNSIVCALHEDPQGRLWVGGQNAGPDITLLQNGNRELFRLQAPGAKAAIRAVIEDKAGNLWVGTHGDGLYRIHGNDQTHFGKKEGLSNEFIRSLYADKEGVLWIGTYGGGLDRFESGHFTGFTVSDGLPSDALCYITEDNAGNLWCGSLGGVFRVRKDDLNRAAADRRNTLQCLTFTTVDGLPTLECSGGSQPSGCKTRDGRLWFPTVRGLAVVDPEAVPFNSLPPPVVIEEIVMEKKGKTGSRVMNVSAVRADEKSGRLVIPAGNQRVEFRYTGLSLVAPRKVRFNYKLEGLEPDWVDAQTRRTANYSYLRPGDYQFRVRACNNDGVWNDEGASLALTILPYFWQTGWFRILVGLSLLLALAGIYEIRLASARKLSRLRLRIARDLHDEVGSNLGSIALLSEVMPKSSGAPVEEVAEVRRIALQTIGSLRDIVWFLDPGADSMSELVSRMREAAKALLHGIAYEFDADGETAAPRPSLELRRNVLPIFKEILHNISKHAGATRVEIRVVISPREFRLYVVDDGVGFDPSAAYAGNGLKNLRRRAADLGAALDIQSQPGHGTTITLTAPIT